MTSELRSAARAGVGVFDEGEAGETEREERDDHSHAPLLTA
jgi:hypothetical protein